MQVTECKRNDTDSNQFFELQDVTKLYPKQLRSHIQKKFLLRDYGKRSLHVYSGHLAISLIIVSLRHHRKYEGMLTDGRY